MIFKTANSTYEIDKEKSRIRRLYGNADPTVRQGNDAEWREFKKISQVEVGSPVLIVWDIKDGMVFKSTQTSVIVSILDSKEAEKCLN